VKKPTEEESQRETILACLNDRWWRLNNLYYIIDRYANRVLFKPNAVQARLDDDLHNLNLVLKSRQHGVTTWACIRALDAILFIPNFRAGIVAHTQFDATKFFQHKVLYAYDNLPLWLRSMRTPTRRDMRDGVLELNNHSSIEVSISHRGGTLNLLHVSEYGVMCALYPERAKEVASGALNTIAAPKPGERPNVVVIESTAHGAHGDFYERSQRAIDFDRVVKAGTAKLTAMDYRLHFFAWFHDPNNTTDPTDVPVSEQMEVYFDGLEDQLGVALTRGQRAWYVKKALEQGEQMRREFPSTPKEAFDASIEGAYYGLLMEKAEADGRIMRLPFNPGQPVYTFWDIGRRDATAIWFMQVNGPWFDFIRFWEVWGEQAAKAARELQSYRADLEYGFGKHYLPHDIEVTEWIGGSDNRTRKQILEDMGVKPIIVVPRIPNEADGIDMVRQVLSRCRFDSVNCGAPIPGGPLRGGIECLKNFRKEWNEKTETFKETPRPDWTNHGADAFRMFAQSFRVARLPGKGGRGSDNGEPKDQNWKTL
jgi:hypothetical protein